MQITIKGASMQQALGNIKKITGSEIATLFVEDEDIWVVASANQKTLKMKVSGTIDKKGKKTAFGFGIWTVSKVIGTREDITLTLQEGKVEIHSKVKNSKVSGEFATNVADIVAIDVEEKAKKLELSPLTLATIQKVIGNINIVGTFGDELELCVCVSERGLEMTMYDDYHCAFFHDPSVTQKETVTFSLPVGLYKQIASLADKDTYLLTLGSAFITAKGTLFEVSMPIMQSDVACSVEQARMFINKLELKKYPKFALSKADILESISTIQAIADSSSFIKISSKKPDLVEFKISNQFGTMSDKRKVKGGGWDKSYSINPSMYLDCLNAYPAKIVNTYIKDDTFIMSCDEESGRYTYFAVLVQ